MFRSAALTLTLCLATITAQASPVSGQGTWEATLQGRAPLTPGGTDYQAYYDTDLNITWVADANLSQTSGYDADGLMGALNGVAQPWIVSLNTTSYLGVSDWRLPTVTNTGASTCDVAATGTDCGYNVDLTTGEMAHMFYSTLQNGAAVDTSGALQPCYTASPDYCLTNTGPFSNLQTDFYWSESNVTFARNFSFRWGLQINVNRSGEYYAWAVRSGDIAAVPIPPAVWLLGTGLAGLGGRRWLRQKASD